MATPAEASCLGASEGRTQLSLPCTVFPPGGKTGVTFLSHQEPFLIPCLSSYLFSCCSLEGLGPTAVTASEFQATLTFLAPCHQQTQNHSITDCSSSSRNSEAHRE